MEVDKVVEQSPLKACAKTGIDPKTVAGKLCTALVVDKTEIGAEIYVVLNSKSNFLGSPW